MNNRKDHIEIMFYDVITLIIFLIIHVFLCIAFVGIIPTALYVFGIVLAKYYGDINIFKKLNKYARIYAYLLTLIFGVIYNMYYSELDWASFFTINIENGFLNRTFTIFINLIILGLYLTIVQLFYIEPILRHIDFSKSIRNAIINSNLSSSTKKTVILQSPSVADEILKLKQLQENGVITEEEFKEMKRKILDK